MSFQISRRGGGRGRKKCGEAGKVRTAKELSQPIFKTEWLKAERSAGLSPGVCNTAPPPWNLILAFLPPLVFQHIHTHRLYPLQADSARGLGAGLYSCTTVRIMVWFWTGRILCSCWHGSVLPLWNKSDLVAGVRIQSTSKPGLLPLGITAHPESQPAARFCHWGCPLPCRVMMKKSPFPSFRVMYLLADSQVFRSA